MVKNSDISLSSKVVANKLKAYCAVFIFSSTAENGDFPVRSNFFPTWL